MLYCSFATAVPVPVQQDARASPRAGAAPTLTYSVLLTKHVPNPARRVGYVYSARCTRARTSLVSGMQQCRRRCAPISSQQVHRRQIPNPCFPQPLHCAVVVLHSSAPAWHSQLRMLVCLSVQQESCTRLHV